MTNLRELSDNDLLKMIVNESSSEERIVTDLVQYFGPSLKEILLYSTMEELLAIRGIGPKKASQILSFREMARRLYEVPTVRGIKITSPSIVYDILSTDLLHAPVEHMKAILLDTKNQVVSVEHISSGTLNASIVHPRDVFKVAVRKNVNTLIISHNHPSGNCNPSQEDISLTNRLVECGNLIGIKLLDHIIIGCQDRYYSFKENNLI